ncbi:nuclear receptor 2C2-associated protein-like [Styela clava]
MSLKNAISQIRVSSVLNRDVKQFGKKHLFDGDDDTCWNSDQGLPQWINLAFEEPQTLSGFCVSLQFQGGFCGKDCILEAYNGTCLVENIPFYPNDINSLQNFEISFTENQSVSSLKLIFQKSTDFFGRIIVYKLDLIKL